jgi:hypothetical protein
MAGNTELSNHPFDPFCRRFCIHYTPRDLAYGQAHHRIFDNLWPSQLPFESDSVGSGGASYTYVITASGHVTFGRCFDEWQVGAKHLVLARERPVLAAGELRVVKDRKTGTCVVWVNLDSGRYMRNLFLRGHQTERALRPLVLAFFRKDRGATRVEYAERYAASLTPDCSPSRDEYERLLSCTSFCEQNPKLAAQVATHLKRGFKFFAD